jgi:hypothetical protein
MQDEKKKNIHNLQIPSHVLQMLLRIDKMSLSSVRPNRHQICILALLSSLYVFKQVIACEA